MSLALYSAGYLSEMEYLSMVTSPEPAEIFLRRRAREITKIPVEPEGMALMMDSDSFTTSSSLSLACENLALADLSALPFSIHWLSTSLLKSDNLALIWSWAFFASVSLRLNI